MAILVLTTNNPIQETLFKNRITTSSADWLTPRNDGIPRKSELGGTESGDIRKLVWSGALKIAGQNPVFGTGPETFGLTYWQARPKEANLTSEWNFLYNKVHNEWLNLAANTGIFGLGSHLLLLGWFGAWTLKQTTRSSWLVARGSPPSAIHHPLPAALLSAILGVEVVNFFGFSTVTVVAYTYLFIGLAVTAGNKEQEARNNEKQGKLSLFPVSCFLLLIAATLYLLSQISFSFLADLSYARGRAYLENRYAFQALRPLEIATELVPNEPTFRSSLAEDEGLLAVSLNATGEQPDLVVKLKNESLQNFEIVARQNPYSLSFLKTASRIVYSLGVFDPTLFTRGIALSEKAMKLAPTNPSIPYTLGVMSEAMGKNDDVERFYRTALELKPDYTEAKEKLKTIPPGFRLQESP
jgi:tetratricopeptide (TPR) repeat protein